MKFKVGDRVRIKSLDWYNENKNKHGDVWFDNNVVFVGVKSLYCGCELTIRLVTNDSYYVIENDYYWTDEMIEGLVEELLDNDMKEHQKIVDEIMAIQEIEPIEAEIEEVWHCPDGYIFKDENGNVINATKIVLEKKKPKYPKTYAECCQYLGFVNNELVFEGDYRETNFPSKQWKRLGLINQFNKLLICCDAYWKIAGEEMGLGKPWEPGDNKVFGIIRQHDKIQKYNDFVGGSTILEFPTEEMRDAFYENFKELIEICKELL